MLGIVEISCAVIYVIPRRAVLREILVTGYFGGASRPMCGSTNQHSWAHHSWASRLGRAISARPPAACPPASATRTKPEISDNVPDCLVPWPRLCVAMQPLKQSIIPAQSSIGHGVFDPNLPKSRRLLFRVLSRKRPFQNSAELCPASCSLSCCPSCRRCTLPWQDRRHDPHEPELERHARVACETA